MCSCSKRWATVSVCGTDHPVWFTSILCLFRQDRISHFSLIKLYVSTCTLLRHLFIWILSGWSSPEMHYQAQMVLLYSTASLMTTYIQILLRPFPFILSHCITLHEKDEDGNNHFNHNLNGLVQLNNIHLIFARSTIHLKRSCIVFSQMFYRKIGRCHMVCIRINAH